MTAIGPSSPYRDIGSPDRDDVPVYQDPTTGALVGAGGQVVLPGFTVVPATRDSDGIDAAIAACVAAGGGMVLYEQARYSVIRNHPIVSGVFHRGHPFQMQFGPADEVPDFWTIPVTGAPGTILDLAPGVTGFTWNAEDQGAMQSPLMNFAVRQFGFYGLAFNGGLRAIKVGAVNAMGGEDGYMDLIYAYNQTCEDDGYAIDVQNTQFFKFGRIRIRNDNATALGGNFRFCCTLAKAVILTGDSDIEHIFSTCASRTRKGVVLEADHPSTALLNNVKIGRIHASRYTSSTPESVSATATSGSANISVPNATEFQLCQVGMPIRFQTTAPTGFDANITYFVVSRNTGGSTIQLAEQDTNSAITPSSSGTNAMYVGGWPTFIARGAQSGSAVKNCNFGDLALEVTGNIGMAMFSKTRNCIVNLENPSSSFTGTSVICRDAEIGVTYGGSDLIGSDETSLTGGLCNFVNLAGGALQYSGGSFSLTSAWNGRKVRYSGTTDITVTIPRRLPPGFEVEFVTTGATGIITIAGASGLGVWSKNGLRSNGQYARIKVSQISSLGYHVTGDTQV